MGQLTQQYFLWIFISVTGVVQLMAARYQLKGILFFERKAFAYTFASIAIGGSFIWFFGWDDPMDMAMKITGDAASGLMGDAPLRRTGLEGAQQFTYFFLGTLAAGVFTLTFSSLLKALLWKEQDTDEASSLGMDALKKRSYFQAVRKNLKREKGSLND